MNSSLLNRRILSFCLFLIKRLGRGSTSTSHDSKKFSTLIDTDKFANIPVYFLQRSCGKSYPLRFLDGFTEHCWIGILCVVDCNTHLLVR